MSFASTPSEVHHSAATGPSLDHRRTLLTRRRAVLAMAAFTVIVEILGMFDLLPFIRVGALDLPLSIIPALALAVACGNRLAGRSTTFSRAAAYWIAASVMLAAVTAEFVRTDRFGLWASLMLAAFGEEMIYRLAIPAVLAVVFRWCGVRDTWARIAGFAVAGAWFVALPGHEKQMTDFASFLPFAAFATLSAVIVYRSGSVLPMATAHAISNLVTVLAWSDTNVSNARGMTVATMLGILVLAYGQPRRLTVSDDGGLVDTLTGLQVFTVDARDDAPAQVTLIDGTTVEVDGPVTGMEST